MCLVAGSILYFGYVDLQEGNVAWLNSGPAYEPKGNVAIRSVWGVAALLLSPMAFLLLFGFAMYRARFATLSVTKQWLMGLGAPLSLAIVLVLLCAIGVAFPYPVVIPYPTKIQEVHIKTGDLVTEN